MISARCLLWRGLPTRRDLTESGLLKPRTSRFYRWCLRQSTAGDLSVGTSIAVAFPRSPAILASIGWDLARFSKGRFILGLGTQVKGHNERRFGVKWDRPVDKMREVILAVRAIWHCWQNKLGSTSRASISSSI